MAWAASVACRADVCVKPSKREAERESRSDETLSDIRL